MKNSKDADYIKDYFKNKDLGVSVIYNGQSHYFTKESLLDATLASDPSVHQFVAKKLQVGSKASVKRLMESIAETILKESKIG